MVSFLYNFDCYFAKLQAFYLIHMKNNSPQFPLIGFPSLFVWGVFLYTSNYNFTKHTFVDNYFDTKLYIL